MEVKIEPSLLKSVINKLPFYMRYKEKIIKLLSESYSESDILKFKSYTMTYDDTQIIKDVAKQILLNFPYLPYACAPMTALWIANIRDKTEIPAHMIAGSLNYKEKLLFGSDDKANFKKIFSVSSLDWCGHCWAQFGDYIGEISLFRTAYSNSSPEWLRNIIIEKFGEKTGFTIGEPHEIKSDYQLEYLPEYIVADDRITMLCNGAYSLAKNHYENAN